MVAGCVSRLSSYLIEIITFLPIMFGLKCALCLCNTALKSACGSPYRPLRALDGKDCLANVHDSDGRGTPRGETFSRNVRREFKAPDTLQITPVEKGLTGNLGTFGNPPPQRAKNFGGHDESD
jgi:hypothetical protein